MSTSTSLLIAGFGAFCQEVLHFYQLRSKLKRPEFQVLPRNWEYWAISAAMVVCSAVGVWALYDDQGLPKSALFILGAAFPALFKKMSAVGGNPPKLGLGPKSIWRTYVGLILVICVCCVWGVSGQNPAAIVRGAQSVRVLVTAARNAEQFSTVYKTAATTPQLEALSRGTKNITALAHTLEGVARLSPTVSFWEKHDQMSEFWGTKQSSGSLQTPHQDASRDLIALKCDIVIGHSVAGDLILPDGKCIAIAELAARAHKSGRILVVVSCHAKEFLPDYAVGTSRAITYEQAADIVKDVIKFLSEKTNLTALADEPSKTTLEDLQRKVDKSEAWHSYKPRFTLQTAAAIGAGGSVTYLIVERLHSRPSGLPAL